MAEENNLLFLKWNKKNSIIRICCNWIFPSFIFHLFIFEYGAILHFIYDYRCITRDIETIIRQVTIKDFNLWLQSVWQTINLKHYPPFITSFHHFICCSIQKVLKNQTKRLFLFRQTKSFDNKQTYRQNSTNQLVPIIIWLFPLKLRTSMNAYERLDESVSFNSQKQTMSSFRFNFKSLIGLILGIPFVLFFLHSRSSK